MKLSLVQQRLQSILDQLRTSVPVLVQIEGAGLAVHSGRYHYFGPDTDWAQLLIDLQEIDPDDDDDIRWEAALDILEGEL